MRRRRFTVITIGFNDLAGLRETRASVDAQSFSDFEWIIVDGGSTDGTLEYLQGLHQPGCMWKSEPDEGIFHAMNKGLDLASGEFVIFMNSGDSFADKDVLERANALLVQKEGQIDLLFGNAYEKNSSGDILLKKARPATSINRGMFAHHQSILYARESIGDTRYDCGFRLAADYHFTSRLLARGARPFYLDLPFSMFRRGGFSEKNAKIGRRENLAVQKDVLRIGPTRRMFNHVSFLIAAFLRVYMRSFYDRLRYRHAAPRNDLVKGQSLGILDR
jgi:putative colanic acid biosynthesis glycosyltransferase